MVDRAEQPWVLANLILDGLACYYLRADHLWLGMTVLWLPVCKFPVAQDFSIGHISERWYIWKLHYIIRPLLHRPLPFIVSYRCLPIMHFPLIRARIHEIRQGWGPVHLILFQGGNRPLPGWIHPIIIIICNVFHRSRLFSRFYVLCWIDWADPLQLLLLLELVGQALIIVKYVWSVSLVWPGAAGHLKSFIHILLII